MNQKMKKTNCWLMMMTLQKTSLKTLMNLMKTKKSRIEKLKNLKKSKSGRKLMDSKLQLNSQKLNNLRGINLRKNTNFNKMKQKMKNKLFSHKFWRKKILHKIKRIIMTEMMTGWWIGNQWVSKKKCGNSYHLLAKFWRNNTEIMNQ